MPYKVFYEVGVAELLNVKPDIAEETIRAEGSTLGAHVAMCAAMAEEVEHDGSMADLDGYLETAEGDGLTRWVASEYKEPRHGATAAFVELEWQRAGTLALVIESGTIVEARLPDGRRVRFTTDTRLEWPALNTSTKTNKATSVEVGPDVNVDKNLVRYVVSSLTDSTVTVNNPAPAAGGNAEEGDDELKARMRNRQARWTRGTAPAVRLGALQVPQVREASVYETLDSTGYPSGSGTVVVADQTGQGNDVMRLAVKAELYEWRPFGGKVVVTYSQPTMLEPVLETVWNASHGSLGDKEVLQQLVAARINKLDPRSDPPTVAVEDINPACIFSNEVIQEVRPLVPGLLRVRLVEPIGVLVPDYGFAFRTRPSLVTVT